VAETNLLDSYATTQLDAIMAFALSDNGVVGLLPGLFTWEINKRLKNPQQNIYEYSELTLVGIGSERSNLALYWSIG
jgi:hypothetical protein